MRHPTTTTLPRLTLRFVMTTALVLSLAQIYGERLTSYFVPSFRAALERLQERYGDGMVTQVQVR